MMKNPVVFLFCCLTITLNSQITFSPGIPYALTSLGPGAILVEDLDDDGDLDIATSETGTGFTYFYAFENNGENFSEQEFSWQLWAETTTNYNDLIYSHYAFGDFDGDGDSDFITHETWGPGTGSHDYFVVMESLGDMQFGQIIPGYGNDPGNCDAQYHFYTHDFNQDGKDEFIRKSTSWCNSAFFRIGLSNGNLMEIDEGGWDWTSTQDVGFELSANSARWRIVDLNDDGIEDCVAMTQDKIFLYPGLEEGFFQSIPFTVFSGSLSSYECLDWDGDGLTDLLTIDNSGTVKIVKHFEGNTFYEWELIESPFGSNLQSFASDDVSGFDFDNDGDIDLIGLNTDQELVILPNINGELGEEVVLSSSGSLTYTIVDFNQDGLADVVSKTGTAIVYFLNGSATVGCTDDAACNYNPNSTEDDGSCEYGNYPYDCDGNCINDLDENGICDEFEQPAPFNPDSNGDGIINLLDLLEIFPLFGQPIETVPCINPE